MRRPGCTSVVKLPASTPPSRRTAPIWTMSSLSGRLAGRSSRGRRRHRAGRAAGPAAAAAWKCARACTKSRGEGLRPLATAEAARRNRPLMTRILPRAPDASRAALERRHAGALAVEPPPEEGRASTQDALRRLPAQARPVAAGAAQPAQTLHPCHRTRRRSRRCLSTATGASGNRGPSAARRAYTWTPCSRRWSVASIRPEIAVSKDVLTFIRCARRGVTFIPSQSDFNPGSRKPELCRRLAAAPPVCMGGN